MATLSVCLVAQDEAALLPRWLENVGAVADEIVAVDGGSRDDTAAILEAHAKVRLLRRPFDAHGAQKNFAFDHARGDWILSLDADELLGDRLRRRLPGFLRLPCVDRFAIPRYWVVSTRPLRYVHAPLLYPDRQLRLFRNRPEFRYLPEPIVHERMPEHGRGVKLRRSHLFHLAFLVHDRAARERRAARYAALEPATARTSAQYLYEDHPHAVRECEEGCAALTR
jgi:glycosyltransferase involved in cell wall biosynthesis